MLNKPRLLTPGPTPLPENVRLALARDMIHHRKAEFKKCMASIQPKLRELFGSTEPVLPLACSGTGAMTAAIYSLFKPGDCVLVVEGGKFGERWREIALSYDLKVVTLKVEWAKAVEPQAVEAALAENPDVKGILAQLCETSTGVLHPIDKIANIKKDKLLVVDGISAVGISPCPMDEWRIDCLLTGSQKGLMLPPGLALISLSHQAWQVAETTRPGCFYFNLPKEKIMLEKGETAFTTPVNLIVALEAALDMMFETGLAQIYKKQMALTQLVRQGAQSLGLEPLVKNDYAYGLTSLKLPQGIDGVEALGMLASKYGIIMAGGQDRLKGKIIRFGHMGWVDWGDCLAGLSALGQTLASMGFTGGDGYLVHAMDAYDRTLLN